MYHIPALLQESVDGLNIHPDGVYVDVTFGGGGHSREILRRLGEKGRLFAFDPVSYTHLGLVGGANSLSYSQFVFYKVFINRVDDFFHTC